MRDPYRAHAQRHLDAEFAQLRPVLPALPPDGWIRTLRTALGMSQRELAERVGITQAAIRQLEESERDGAIQVRSLRRVAAALGARLEYTLVPSVPLEQTVRDRATDVARRELEAVNRSMELEQQRPGEELDEELVRRRAEELIESPRLWSDR